MTADWPTEAHRSIVNALSDFRFSPLNLQADAVLAALAPHVQPRTDDWEWGSEYLDGGVPCVTVGDGSQYNNLTGRHFRRRPASEWEVAP